MDIIKKSDKDIATFIRQRKSEMESRNSDIANRYEINNRRFYSFLLRDMNGEYGLPTSWVTVNHYLGEIMRNFDGSLIYIPNIDSAEHDRKKYDYLSKVYNQEGLKRNIKNERRFALRDALLCGLGVMYEGYLSQDQNKKKNQNSFNGRVSQRVDPRDLFIDNSAQRYYDPVGRLSPKDVIWRMWFKKDCFKKVFSGKEYNQKAVQSALNAGTTTKSRSGQNIIYFDSAVQIDSQNNIIGSQFVDDVIAVYEYWTKNERVLIAESGDEVIYKGENKYENIPFAFFVPYPDPEYLYSVGILDVIAPTAAAIEYNWKLWLLNNRLTASPIIFADKDTGLLAGGELQPGIQFADLRGASINNKIQQLNLNNHGNDILQFSSYTQDLLIQASGVDTRSLQDRPNELATQTKSKLATETRRINDIIDTMMETGESQRGFLGGVNIMKFLFSEERDVIINDYVENKDGFLESAKGAITKLRINKNDWKNFEFDVVIESKSRNEFQKQEKLVSGLKLLDILRNFMADPNVPPEMKQNIKFESLFEQIVNQFPEYDASEIFQKKGGKSQIEEEMNMVLSGKSVDTSGISEKDRNDRLLFSLKNVSQLRKTSPEKSSRLLRHIIELNKAEIEDRSQSSQPNTQ